MCTGSWRGRIGAFEGPDDAARQRFEVINMSLGALVSFGPDQNNRDVAAIRSATKRVNDRVLRAGTVIVASAGNDAFDLTRPALNLPGGTPGIIDVGATGVRPDPIYPQPGSYDVLAFYSNVGAPVDIVAPHVAGAAGLLRDAEPRLNPRQVDARLRQTADRIGHRLTFGHGMVDADAAIR